MRISGKSNLVSCRWTGLMASAGWTRCCVRPAYGCLQPAARVGYRTRRAVPNTVIQVPYSSAKLPSPA